MHSQCCHVPFSVFILLFHCANESCGNGWLVGGLTFPLANKWCLAASRQAATYSNWQQCWQPATQMHLLHLPPVWTRMLPIEQFISDSGTSFIPPFKSCFLLFREVLVSCLTVQLDLLPLPLFICYFGLGPPWVCILLLYVFRCDVFPLFLNKSTLFLTSCILSAPWDKNSSLHFVLNKINTFEAKIDYKFKLKLYQRNCIFWSHTNLGVRLSRRKHCWLVWCVWCDISLFLKSLMSQPLGWRGRGPSASLLANKKPATMSVYMYPW